MFLLDATVYYLEYDLNTVNIEIGEHQRVQIIYTICIFLKRKKVIHESYSLLV